MLSPHSDDKVLDKLNQCANKEQLTIWHVIGLDEKILLYQQMVSVPIS